MKTISNRKSIVKVNKSVAARSFVLNKEAAKKMQVLNWDECEISLVRDDKGQMFTRIYRPEVKKGGKWRPLPSSVWLCNDKLAKIGWDKMTSQQKREMYTMTPVTQSQALKWLINESVQNEVKADFMKMYEMVISKQPTLPEGEYLFAVKSMAKGVSTDETTKGAPQVKVEMSLYALDDENYEKQIGVGFDNLIRHSKTESNICQFFKAIGALDHAQAVTPNWDTVPGATGRAMFYMETIDGKTVLKVKRYMDPEEVLMRISA
ncbi:MAG: hypothetical protein NT011_07860 [Kiritimatiellaeota bacterium]|nr:hypothetical protein [Kiritimatiellota bacterium]